MHTISISKRSLFSLIILSLLCLDSTLFAQKLGQRKIVKPPQIALPVIFTCGEDHAVKRLNAKGMMSPIGAHSDKVTAMALVSGTQGSLIVSGDAIGNIKVWNTAYSRLLLEQRAHDKAVTALAVSPDGKTIATTGEEGRLRLWDRKTGKRQFEVQGIQGASPALFYSLDGKILYATTPTELLSWRVVNLLNGARHLYPEPNQQLGTTKVNAAAISLDGSHLALACEDSYVRIWNIVTKHEETKILASEFPLTAVAWTSNGQWAAAGDTRGNIRVWEVSTGKPRPFLCRAGASVRGLGFSSNGQVLVSANSTGTVHFWETSGGLLISQKPIHPNGITQLTVLP